MKALRLETFLPYRLSVLANEVSTRLASVYAERFGLTIPEWRVMAVLGEATDVSADFVCDKTGMDRVTVSRAVSRLLVKRHILRRFCRDDRRRSRLALSASGRRIYDQIVPLARRYEEALSAVLEPAERATLDRLISRLQARARVLGDEAAWVD
ncbi:MAG: winged helix-turn-helix transcriptional regulator [Gammaproteobacteria bacterium]|nr:winged helix-turn-helix transcriptional regulator [Gammaproteobacteria bacterium]